MFKEVSQNEIFAKRKLIIRVSYLLYYFFILYFFVLSLSIRCGKRIIKSNNSIIHLTVHGGENKQILSSYFEKLPDEIHINEIKQTHISIRYNLLDNFYYSRGSGQKYYLDNSVTLIWKSQINSASKMFYGCIDITVLNFSDFDSSYIVSTELMFYKCSSLMSLYFTNFKTISVINMSGMFSGCSSLRSLNLSSFNTSFVNNMESMFQGCSSLNSLNLNSFDISLVKNMTLMFNKCSSLKSLDLSNAKALSIQTMNKMFSDCSSLKELYLFRFDNSKDISMEEIFDGSSSLELINIKEININNDLKSKIFDKDLKILTICNYEENNYETFFSKENKTICNNISIDDLFEEKIFECFSRYHCGLCGENFFRIYKDKKNNNSYSNCYKFPSGYYLDLS